VLDPKKKGWTRRTFSPTKLDSWSIWDWPSWQHQSEGNPNSIHRICVVFSKRLVSSFFTRNWKMFSPQKTAEYGWLPQSTCLTRSWYSADFLRVCVGRATGLGPCEYVFFRAKRTQPGLTKTFYDLKLDSVCAMQRTSLLHLIPNGLEFGAIWHCPQTCQYQGFTSPPSHSIQYRLRLMQTSLKKARHDQCPWKSWKSTSIL